MIFANKREWRRARRAYARNRMRYKDSRPPEVRVGPAETRDDLIVRANEILKSVGWKKNDPAHPMSSWEVRQNLAEVAILRAAAMGRPRIDPTGRAFYVTIIDGAQKGWLYGPFGTHLAALRALPIAKSYTLDAYPGTAFAAFGTASRPQEIAMPGVLNHLLPPILEAA